VKVAANGVEVPWELGFDARRAPRRDTRRTLLEGSAFERHYRISDLAALWGLGRETIRKIVCREAGVIKVRFGRKKSHTTYSIPASVAARIHTRLLNGG